MHVLFRCLQNDSAKMLMLHLKITRDTIFKGYTDKLSNEGIQYSQLE